jgi:two-component system CheB/CheR fusion protein
MDGYELGQRLRSAGLSACTMVAITGYSQPSDQLRSKESGFQHHLVRPVKMHDLDRILSEL